jgi:hypothetical protein
MRWTRQRRARRYRRASQTRERFNRVRKTNGAFADGEVVWSWHPLLMLSLAEARSANRVSEASFNP